MSKAVDQSSGPCRDGAKSGPHKCGENRPRDANRERDAAGEHHPDQEVAPEAVRPEQMPRSPCVACARGEQASREQVADRKGVRVRQSWYEHRAAGEDQQQESGEPLLVRSA